MKQIFPVSGMHCVSCETLLEKEVSCISGVQKCKASHKKGTLEVECDKSVLKKEIENAIQKCGYNKENSFQKKGKVKVSGKDLLQIGGIFVGIFFLVTLFSHFELSRFFPDANKEVGIFMAILLGFVASISTCLALTGGIVMSFSSIYSSQKDASLWHRLFPQLSFQFGRIGGFAILGGVLGSVGSALRYSSAGAGYLTIFVAFIMLYTGLHILGFVPSITRFGMHLPKIFSSPVHALQQKKHPIFPAIIGVLTFFLPCGFTQSLQLVAVASGSFWAGSLIMFSFALGTFPVLFSVGLGSSYAKQKDFGFFRKIIGVFIIFFGLFSLQSGLVLAGSKVSLDFWSTAPPQNAIPSDNTSGEVQVVTMDIDYTFQQTEFRVRKGVPVQWEINAIHTTGCADEVIIPRLGISSGKLKSGKNVVEFTPTETGTLPFSCWMGMQNGKFLVED